MSLPKLFVFTLFAALLLIGSGIILKKCTRNLSSDVPQLPPQPATVPIAYSPALTVEIAVEPEVGPATPLVVPSQPLPPVPVADASPRPHLPEVDRVEELFRVDSNSLPIVETITYHSKVPWQKGRAAWLSDYATYYQTSRHFIARSLNQRPDYLKQEVAEGDRFNVLRKEYPFQFYFLVDTSLCKMWFYYIHMEKQTKTLLKTYSVGLGRVDGSKASGLLTPLGKYQLGGKTAVYQPKTMGTYKGKNIEMISVFGTRWIPFEKEVGFCTAPARGFGLHGTPWTRGKDGISREEKESIGKFESDGCIRLATADMEEIYAIVITEPTTIEIVSDYAKADLMKWKDE